jgi:16S rRNA (cytidine1402-2'-O)-methyltransferase
MSEYGVLTLCATPIGNLEDITYRAIKVLKEADFIAAEDTRHTKKLLNHFEIQTRLISYHEHNKIEKGPELIEKLKEGLNIALVTDAGTPGISDPGEDLVRLALEAGITVTSAPGAVAGITALIISGQSTRRFVFEGFLPSAKKEKDMVLQNLEKEIRTIVLYEAPHRLVKTLKSLYDVLGKRQISIVKELTKKYETLFKADIEAAIAHYEENEPRGEYVLVIEGKNQEELEDEQKQKWEELSIEEHMEVYTKQGLDEKSAMKQVAKDRGVGKREIYQYLHQN